MIDPVEPADLVRQLREYAGATWQGSFPADVLRPILSKAADYLAAAITENIERGASEQAAWKAANSALDRSVIASKREAELVAERDDYLGLARQEEARADAAEAQVVRLTAALSAATETIKRNEGHYFLLTEYLGRVIDAIPRGEWKDHDGVGDSPERNAVLEVRFFDGDERVGFGLDWDQNWTWKEGEQANGSIVAYRVLVPDDSPPRIREVALGAVDKPKRDTRKGDRHRLGYWSTYQRPDRAKAAKESK